MRKYRGSVNFKDEDFKAEVIFILVYYFGIFIFPTVVIDDKVFMSISDLKCFGVVIYSETHSTAQEFSIFSISANVSLYDLLRRGSLLF